MPNDPTGIGIFLAGAVFAVERVLKIVEHIKPRNGTTQANSKAEEIAAIASATSEAVWKTKVLSMMDQQLELLSEMHKVVQTMAVVQDRQIELSGDMKKGIDHTHQLLERRLMQRRDLNLDT